MKAELRGGEGLWSWPRRLPWRMARLGEGGGVDAKHKLAGDVHNLVLLAELPEQGKKKVANFVAAAECDKGEKSGLCYEELSLLALASPGLVVGVEDAVAEDIEYLGEFMAFGVVVEVDVEDVVDVGGVAGDEQLHAGEPWAEEKEGAVGGAQDFSHEVVEAVDVDGEAW
ncbi:hypothetical protein IEQ34_018602 [Dendrobium chrysotoxum]|uniref:Uncharacterized protein n=1 Tax=Dendrobium chrysotoxum TaxID=161865 RepID=A0AAV7G687_DENCH|nr:hypothetical protein IEQ34_018602 [Dendrobium chrysotoxum]